MGVQIMDEKIMSNNEWYMVESSRCRIHAIRLAMLHQSDGGGDVMTDSNEMMMVFADMLKDALKPIDDFCKRTA